MDSSTAYWVIYISGFLLTYIGCKWLRNKDNDNTWDDVGATVFASIFSWIAIVFFSVIISVIFIGNVIKLKNPPKWL